MRSRTTKKPGHRREISKQIIKLNLMNDLYPIPSRQSQNRNKNSSKHAASKIKNVLNFLKYTHSQELMLQLFQQKISLQLTLSPKCVQNILKGIKAECQVTNLLTNLVCRKEQEDKNTTFLLRGLISTSYKEVRELIQLFFFFHFLKTHQDEYRTIMRQFQTKNIFQALCNIKSLNGELLTSKIISVLAMVYIKYGQTTKLSTIAPKVIDLRRQVQKNYFGYPTFNIDEDHVGTTFYISLKYLQKIIKVTEDTYELIQRIKGELSIVSEYYRDDKIETTSKFIFVEEINKLKEIASSKLQHDYFHSNYSGETLKKKENRTKLALKQFKEKRKSLSNSRCRSIFVINSSKEKDQKGSYKDLQSSKSQKVIERPSQNFRDVYNIVSSSKKITQFSKLKSETVIKKSKKVNKIQFQGSKTFFGTIKPQVSSSTSYPTLFTKLTLHNKEENKKKEQKQAKITQIYKAFSNQNKVLRDIPAKNLKRQLQDIFSFDLGHKSTVKEMYKKQIIDFSAGLQHSQGQFKNILTVKSCLELEFLKLWIGKTYRCLVNLNLGQSEFVVEVTLNGIRNTVILHRGNNVLCQRYLTIWPTIRYLIDKKIAQLTIFKHYELELVCRKINENLLTGLCGDYYFQKFGLISKQQIEEVNICLDNLIKLVLVLCHYKKKNTARYQLSKQYKYKLLFPLPPNGQSHKMSMLTQIYLNQCNTIKLCDFLVQWQNRFYLLTVQISRDKLLKSINNKAVIQILVSALNLEKNKTVKASQGVLNWIQLENQYIFYQGFVSFVMALCSKVGVNYMFLTRFIHFIQERIHIEDRAIFQTQLSFKSVSNISYLTQNYHKKHHQNNSLPVFISNYRTNVIQSQVTLEEIQVESVLILQTLLNTSQKTNKNIIQTHSNIRESSKGFNEKKAKKKAGEKVISWRQQRKIDNKKHLIIITFKSFSNKDQYQVQYTIINRSTESKDILTLNHLDFEAIYGRPKIVEGISSEINIHLTQSYHTQKNRKQSDLALKLLNSIKFYHHHHIRKIYINSHNGCFRHAFKSKRKQQIQQLKRLTKMSNTIKKLPYLQRFQFGCKLRVSKLLKIGSKFAIVTFRRMIIDNQTFWQIIVQFARDHISHVVQLDQEHLTYLLSDHSFKHNVHKSMKPHSRFLISSHSLVPRSSRQSPQNISISLQSKQQQFIDYKQRILLLFERKDIGLITNGAKMKVIIKDQTFPLQKRIIEQWDYQRQTLFSVWMVDQNIQIQAQYPKQEPELMLSSNSEQSAIKALVQETIGIIQLNYLYRFYEMENKEVDQEMYYLKRVCKFYLEWCKQKRYRYENQQN